MKMRFKSKGKQIQSKMLGKIVFFTIVFVFSFTFFLLQRFSKSINHHLIGISEAEVQKVTYGFITERINHHLLNKETLNDILVITKNKNDEILSVDFNLDQAYQVLDNISKVLTCAIEEMEHGEIGIAYYDNDLSHSTNGLSLSIPIGSVLDNSYFYNLGPKLPVKVNFIGSVLTNLETKVTNYGLNNALVEVFVYVEFHNQLIVPFQTKEMTLKYDAVIASMMIEGQVPSFYNGMITKDSGIYLEQMD